MSSWAYSRFGVTVKKEKEKLARQVMKCLGIELNDYEFLWAETESSRELLKDSPDIIGCADGAEELFEGVIYVLYDVMNKLFGQADVYYVHEESSSVEDYYNRFECVMKCAQNKLIWASCIFCDGENTVGVDGENPYCLLKDEIEKAAKKKNIPIAWLGNGDSLAPDSSNEAFDDLAFHILQKNHDKIATQRGEDDIEMPDAPEDFKGVVNSIMTAAKESGYRELVALLRETFGDIIEDSDIEIAECVEKDDPTQMTELEKQIYKYVRSHDGLIMINLAIEDFPGVSKAKLKSTLEKMCDKGILERRQWAGAYSFPF